MTTQKHIGVDLGAESGPVMVGEVDGERIRLSEKHRFPTGGVEISGTLRWDVLHFWREIQNGLASIAAEAALGIASVGVDTWGVDHVLLGNNDEVVGFPRHYRDRRTNGMLAVVTSRVSRSEIFQQTGIQFMEINTLYQLTAAQRSGGLFERAQRFLTIPDFFHCCLSGQAVAEFTNATTNQCFHPITRDWARSLLGQLDIPTQMFPDGHKPSRDSTHFAPWRRAFDTEFDNEQRTTPDSPA